MSATEPTPPERELVALLELSEKATPGEFLVVGPSIYALKHHSWKRGVEQFHNATYASFMGDNPQNDAAFIAALVNWFRSTRAATLPQGVSDQDAGDFAHGYVKGYRAGLGAASAECRRIGEALDGGGNSYVRYEDAIKCSVSVAGLHAPRPDATPHSTEDCYQHFLSYSGLSDLPAHRYAYFHGADVGLDRPQELLDASPCVHGMGGSARVLDRGFTFSGGVNVPTVLVGFAPEDWTSRDAFAIALAAPEPHDGRGSWISDVFRPLPESEAKMLRDVGAPGFEQPLPPPPPAELGKGDSHV